MARATVVLRRHLPHAHGRGQLVAHLALALSAVVGFVLGALGATAAYLLCLILPAASFLSSRYAWENVTSRPLELQAPSCQPINDGLRRGAVVSLLIGLAVFNLALGAARGFPSGLSISLSMQFQALHPAATVLLCVAVLWFCCYEFSRCSSIEHFIVYGAAWTAHLLPRELGRLAIFHGGPFWQPVTD